MTEHTTPTNAQDEHRESPWQVIAWMGGACALVAGAIAFLA